MGTWHTHTSSLETWPRTRPRYARGEWGIKRRGSAGDITSLNVKLSREALGFRCLYSPGHLKFISVCKACCPSIINCLLMRLLAPSAATMNFALICSKWAEVAESEAADCDRWIFVPLWSFAMWSTSWPKNRERFPFLVRLPSSRLISSRSMVSRWPWGRWVTFVGDKSHSSSDWALAKWSTLPYSFPVTE